MGRKKVLERRMQRLQSKIDELTERSQAEDIEITELRSIEARLRELKEDIEDVQEELDALEEEGEPRGRVDLCGFDTRGMMQLGAFLQNGLQERSDNPMDSVEYRTAFMNNVLRNEPIPAELRANANTLTSDVSSTIPTVLVNRIIERMDQCGMILPLVTRTSYAAGVVIPTSNVKPVASWVSEGAGSDRQKKTTGKITFAYFKLRCEISMSMEAGTMALSAFEAKFVENVANAMVIAIEKAILAGNGTTQPKGILTETPADTLEIAKAALTYKELVAVEAKVPAEFESTAKWFMTKGQFMNFVGMTDANGQPIARVNYGINGKPERVLLGRDVIIHPYAEEMGDVVAAIFDFNDYVLNTIYDMGIQKKQDWDTEDLLTKAVMSVDGKVIDTGSLITLKVKAGA